VVSKVGRFCPKTLAFFLEFTLKNVNFQKRKFSFSFRQVFAQKKLTESFGEDVQTSGEDSFVLLFCFLTLLRK